MASNLWPVAALAASLPSVDGLAIPTPEGMVLEEDVKRESRVSREKRPSAYFRRLMIHD